MNTVSGENNRNIVLRLACRKSRLLLAASSQGNSQPQGPFARNFPEYDFGRNKV